MSECSTRYQHYIETLIAYRDAGYKAMRFIDYARSDRLPDKTIILRHDVDFSLKAAAEMASLESANGFQSSFFLRVHAHFYSVFDVCSMASIGMMLDSGHEIGLHVGSGESQRLRENPEHSMDRQLCALVSVIDAGVQSASAHPPLGGGMPERVAEWVSINGLRYTYDKPYFKDIKYLSDSRNSWREGCFCKWINEVPRLQVLTHPVWWHHKVPEENY